MIMRLQCILSLLFSTLLVSKAHIIIDVNSVEGVAGEDEKQQTKLEFTGGVAVYDYNPVNEDITEYVWKFSCPFVADDKKTTHPNPQQVCSDLIQYKDDLSPLKKLNKNNGRGSSCPQSENDQEFAAFSLRGKLHDQKVEVMEVKYSNRCTLQEALVKAGLSYLIPFDTSGAFIPPIDTATYDSS